MKGRSNSKPTRKYHDAIIALLRQERVAIVGGGGYKPKNNFHLWDLTPEQQAALYTEKPGLFSVQGLSPDAEALLQQTQQAQTG